MNLSLKRKISEKKLVDDYVASQIKNFSEHKNDIDKIITGLRFASEDIEPRNILEWDILICEIASDSRALFNILKKEQAERMYKYLAIEAIQTLDKELNLYISNELFEYREIIQDAIAQSELPDDSIYSKLITNILGENRNKYSISSFHMMQLMQLTYVFSGMWKIALDNFLPY